MNTTIHVKLINKQLKKHQKKDIKINSYLKLFEYNYLKIYKRYNYIGINITLLIKLIHNLDTIKNRKN